MYKKVIVALDLLHQERSSVMEKAEWIASNSNAELYLIHVVEQLYNYGPPPYAFNMSEIQDQLIKAAEESLHVFAKTLSIPQERQFTPVGNAKEIILEKAEELHADLIIVGSHSRKGFSDLLLGSTANGVIHGAHCDVLAVRVAP